MPLVNSPEHQVAVDRFWSNYLFVLKNNGVPAKSMLWYRKHIEAYIKVHEITPLSHHTGQEIDQYLNENHRDTL